MSVECRCKLDEELVFRSIGDEEDDGAVTDPDEAGDAKRTLGGGDCERRRRKSFCATRLLLTPHNPTEQRSRRSLQ